MSNRSVEEDVQFSCPSFNSYSQNNQIAEIASRVASENDPQNDAVPIEQHPEEDDFEFSLQLTEDGNISPNDSKGQIFPVFNRDLLLLQNEDDDNDEEESQIGVPLITLLKKEKTLSHRDHNSSTNNDNSNIIDSCSSSEADELESIPSGTYCVWRANNKSCKKSQSAGSASKRWASLRNLMKRSNSEGMKDNFVILTALKSKHNNKEDHRKGKEQIITRVKNGPSSSSSSSSHEQFYVRNKAVKEGDKKKPYRKEPVGFFVNGTGFLPHVGRS